MNFEKLTYVPLPIRIRGWCAFMIYGFPKLSNISATEHLFSHVVGLPAMELPIGLLELIGEVALIVEILTGIAAGLFIIEMIGTTIIISREGFVGGYELALLLLPIPVSLILTGPGIKTTILTVM
jgi:uncharacterized membrane protein YphA (DoxX/SURF4 family)